MAGQVGGRVAIVTSSSMICCEEMYETHKIDVATELSGVSSRRYVFPEAPGGCLARCCALWQFRAAHACNGTRFFSAGIRQATRVLMLGSLTSECHHYVQRWG